MPWDPIVALIPSSRSGSASRSQGLTNFKPLAVAAYHSPPQLPSSALQGSTARSSVSPLSLMGHSGNSAASSLAFSFKQVVSKFQKNRGSSLSPKVERLTCEYIHSFNKYQLSTYYIPSSTLTGKQCGL